MKRSGLIFNAVARTILAIVPFFVIGTLLTISLLSWAFPDRPVFDLYGPGLLGPAFGIMVIVSALWPLMLLGAKRLPISRPFLDSALGLFAGFAIAVILILPASFATEASSFTQAGAAAGIGLVVAVCGIVYWWIAVASKTLWIALLKLSIFAVALFAYRDIRQANTDEHLKQNREAIGIPRPNEDAPAARNTNSTPLQRTLGNRKKDLQAGIAAARRGDYATGLRLLEPLAQRGDADAQAEIGIIYMQTDYNPEPDYPKAVKWLERAYAQGRTDLKPRIDAARRVIEIDAKLAKTRQQINQLDGMDDKLDKLEKLIAQQCGGRTCAIVDGRIVYKSQNGLYWHNGTGRILPREKWPTTTSSK